MDGQEALKRVFPLAVLLALTTAPAISAPFPGFVRASGTSIVDGAGAPLILRGVNLGGWLLWESYLIRLNGEGWTESRIKSAIVGAAGRDAAYAFFRAHRDRFTTRADLKRIRALGWNVVRIPFNSRILDPGGHFDLKPGEGWMVLDRVLDWCEAEGLYAVLDMHSAPGGQNGQGISDTGLELGLFRGDSTTRYREETAGMWGAIAARYRDRAVVAAYDILNEPVVPNELGPAAAIPDVYRRCIAAIRAADTRHMVMIEGNWYASDFSMFQPPALDANLCYQFHKYWGPVTPGDLKGRLELRTRLAAPVWLGETGENCPGWYARCMAQMEEAGIGWCFWPWKRMGGGCPVGIVEPEAWKQVAAALKPGRSEAPYPVGLSRAQVIAGLRSLSEAVALGRCREDAAVIAALTGRRPVVAHIPGRVEAEDFLPIEGQGYHDTEKDNQGGGCAQGEGVDVQWGRDGVVNVGWTQPGEWLTWSVTVAPGTGVFDLRLRCAAEADGGSFTLAIDGVAVSSTLPVPKTGGWQVWKEVSLPIANLKAGEHVVRLDVVTGGFNLDYLEFTPRQKKSLER